MSKASKQKLHNIHPGEVLSKEQNTARRLGFMQGEFTAPDDFDQMGKDEIAHSFKATAMQYNMREARNQFSKLVQSALSGKDVVIARNGIPAVRLVKTNTLEAMRKLGAWADLPKADADWNALVSHSKDPDLQKAPQALLRAAEKARQLAEQTGTAFVERKSAKPATAADKQK